MKKIIFLGILMFAICLSACGSKKAKFGILSWNENAGSEVIEACGLNPDDYELTCKTLPEIDVPGPENSDNESLSREASIIDSAFEFVTHDYSVVAFQMNEYWNSAAQEFMEENPDLTVYILDETGSSVLYSQNAVSVDATD